METLLSSASMYSTHSLTNSSTHKATLVGGVFLVCRRHTRMNQTRIGTLSRSVGCVDESFVETLFREKKVELD